MDDTELGDSAHRRLISFHADTGQDIVAAVLGHRNALADGGMEPMWADRMAAEFHSEMLCSVFHDHSQTPTHTSCEVEA